MGTVRYERYDLHVPFLRPRVVSAAPFSLVAFCFFGLWLCSSYVLFALYPCWTCFASLGYYVVVFLYLS